jgi:hypothetical protein
MSYAQSESLQRAIYETLAGNSDLQARVGDAIYDVVPPGQLPPTYVSIGPEDVRDWSDKTSRGARHDFTVSVVTEAAGFQTAKIVAGAVADALMGANTALDHGRMVLLTFRRARAVRIEDGNMRRIDMSFRALIAEE